MRRKKERKREYPGNLLYDVLVEDLTMASNNHRLSQGQMEALDLAMRSFTPQEVEVIMRRYQLMETYRSIGESMGLTQEKSRNICSKALRKLRNPVYVKMYLIMQEKEEQHYEKMVFGSLCDFSYGDCRVWNKFRWRKQ